jgi:hypothetical protein
MLIIVARTAIRFMMFKSSTLSKVYSPFQRLPRARDEFHEVTQSGEEYEINLLALKNLALKLGRNYYIRVIFSTYRRSESDARNHWDRLGGHKRKKDGRYEREYYPTQNNIIPISDAPSRGVGLPIVLLQY